MGRKVILFELNEVPWRVLEDTVQLRPQGAVARLLSRGRSYETFAEDTALSPWITWPTLHRGVTDEEHTISDFGQDLQEIDEAFPPVWEILARNGVSTGVFGSLHSYPLPWDLSHYSFFVPDVFAAGSECFPREVEPFQEFNLEMSRRSARNVGAAISWRPALRFLRNAPALGLKPGTAAHLGLHLLDERRRRWAKVRRRTYQVVLAFDLFMKQLSERRPRFATFFTNHVASSMHRYWAARYPEDYDDFRCSAGWVETYQEEIDWTMAKAEAMLERLERFVEANPEYELWVASSMGQAATEANQVHTQVYLEDVPRFMRVLGVAEGDWERRPAMLPRIILSLRPERAEDFAQQLDRIQVAGRPISWKRLSYEVFRIHPGTIQNVVDETCEYGGRTLPFHELGFVNLPIEDAAGTTAYHVPRGSLVRYDPGRPVEEGALRTEVSTRDIAPSLLSRFGVSPPNYMRGSRLL